MVFAVTSAFAACSFDPKGLPMASDGDSGATDAPSSTDGQASTDADPTQPDADPNVDADIVSPTDAMPDAEICLSECLVNDQFRDCGNGGIIIDCPLGCGGGTPHCFQLDPSNGADESHLLGVTSGLLVAANQSGIIDSDTGQIDIDSTPERVAGTGVFNGMGFYTLSPTTAVLAVDSVTFETNSYVRVDGTRSLIILSRGDIVLGGFIDIAGGCVPAIDGVDCARSGGGTGATNLVASSGCGPGGDGFGGSGPEAGGGGGALGQAGARGGNGDATHTGGAGGTTAGCPGASLIPLVGGSGGGVGGSGSAGAGGFGGGGGGALQLSSYTSIDVVGTLLPNEESSIWAGGAGGGGAVGGNGGGGGGGGGALLLEAPAITISHALIGANGGGGGGGDNGADGTSGQLSTGQAPGGAGAAPSNGGGDGGSAAGAPTIGGEPIDGGGGGGGGAGLIRLNVPVSGLTIGSSTISPLHTRADPVVL